MLFRRLLSSSWDQTWSPLELQIQVEKRRTERERGNLDAHCGENSLCHSRSLENFFSRQWKIEVDGFSCDWWLDSCSLSLSDSLCMYQSIYLRKIRQGLNPSDWSQLILSSIFSVQYKYSTHTQIKSYTVLICTRDVTGLWKWLSKPVKLMRTHTHTETQSVSNRERHCAGVRCWRDPDVW